METQAGLPAAGAEYAAVQSPRRAHHRGLDIAAGLLGAVTAIGMALVLLLGTVAVACVLARARHADAETVATRILAHTIAVDAIGAALLCLLVLIAFFSGGTSPHGSAAATAAGRPWPCGCGRCPRRSGSRLPCWLSAVAPDR